MLTLTELGGWIAANESLLSGMAAMIVLAGVVLSPLGVGLRRLAVGRSRSEASGVVESPIPVPISSSGPVASELPVRLTFKTLTAPSPHATKFADSDGVRIAYNERGSGPHTLICAPGIISHLHITDNLPATKGTYGALGRFARVLTFDKRGQGLSDPTLTAPSLEERAQDIAAVMDDAGIERAVLVGTSEGGPMCLHFAHAHPERVQGLVLLGTTARWLQSDDFPIGLQRSVLEALPRSWGRGVLRDIFFPSLSREEMDDDTYRAFERLIATRESVGQIVEMMIETDVRPMLPEIQVPALVIHFTGDLAVPIRLGRALAAALPNAEFMEVNAVDHADLSQSSEAIEGVRLFCERLAGESASSPARAGTPA